MRTSLDVVRGAYDAWEAHDVVEALCALHPDVRMHCDDGLPYEGDYHGRGAVADLIRDVISDWTWLEVRPFNFTASGAIVAVTGIYEARGRVTGHRFVDDFVHLWTVADGRGVRMGAYRDPAAAMDALDELDRELVAPEPSLA